MQGIANRTKVHQNKYAFAHNPHSKKSARIMGIPNVGLCQRCHDIIEWRKKFRKYKPIKNLTKCACCGEKKVRSAYHNWCTDCAKSSNVCPKCLLDRDIIGAAVAELTQESIQEMLVQVGMKERVRRKIWRLWQNEKATDEELRQMIFSYNPDAKDEPDEDEEEEEKAAGPMSASAVAARGPPPKPKAPAPKPAAAAPAPAAANDEDDEDDDCDYLDDSEEDEEDDESAAAAATELARQQAAKRGPPPKPKQRAAPAAAPAAAAADVAGLEQAVATASISDAAAVP